MREIRYRAFHKATKEICEVAEISLVNRYVIVLPESELEGGNTVDWMFDDIVLTEHIGLNDCNGKPIFTGDQTYHLAHDTKCLIKWSDNLACYVAVDKDDFDTNYFYQKIDEKSLSIIGTNPELL